jgi:hypothetical protein
MTTSPLIFNLILPALGGLGIGFSAGLTVGAIVTLRWICRKLPEGDGVPIYRDDTNPTPGRRPTRSREHFSRLGWVFVILGLLGCLLGAWSLWKNQETAAQTRATAACVAQFTQFNAETQQQRAVAADIDRQATAKQRDVTRELLRGITKLLTTDFAGDRDAYFRARDELVTKLQAADHTLDGVDQLYQQAQQQRDANPVPPAPAC